MSNASPTERAIIDTGIKGIEFRRFFRHQRADSLRFLTALRMNATFPYITPNVVLPSVPPMEVIDAGLADNFGVSDALRFLFVFREWIEANTSGVILVRITDKEKEVSISNTTSFSVFRKLISPLGNVIANLDYQQTRTNDAKIEYAKGWFHKPLYTIDLAYDPSQLLREGEPPIVKAPLSWRLTQKEIDGLRQVVQAPANASALRRLQQLLRPMEAPQESTH
jgi:hypothetical protein